MPTSLYMNLGCGRLINTTKKKHDKEVKFLLCNSVGQCATWVYRGLLYMMRRKEMGVSRLEA